MKTLKGGVLSLADVALAPLVYPAAWLLRTIRTAGVARMPACKRVLMKMGVFPIRDHYYEPQFDLRATRQPLAQERPLPGIDWNIDEQMELLHSMRFAAELADTPRDKPEHVYAGSSI